MLEIFGIVSFPMKEEGRCPLDKEDVLLFRKDSVSIFLIPSLSGNLHDSNFGLSPTAMQGRKCRLYLRFLSNT